MPRRAFIDYALAFNMCRIKDFIVSYSKYIRGVYIGASQYKFHAINSNYPTLHQFLKQQQREDRQPQK